VLDDIMRAARSQLADYKLPERLTPVDTIPRNALGKVDRKSLPLAVVSSSAGTDAPRDRAMASI
jgi:non-ribosomal peptide synthetase component E (peptide arylation enzyme)